MNGFMQFYAHEVLTIIQRIFEKKRPPLHIQFLSRQEHYSAHNGNFQNPTNGYFNPNTGETSDFGSNKYEPCKIIELSEPILCPTDGQTQSATENTSTSTNTSDVLITPGISNSEKSGFGGTVKRLTSKVANFYDRHKDVIHNVIASTPVIAAIVTEVIKGRTRGSSKNSTSPSLTDASIGNTTASIQHEDLVERASPSENTVPAHRQRYGKDKVWKDKESYVRGKNTDE